VFFPGPIQELPFAFRSHTFFLFFPDRLEGGAFLFVFLFQGGLALSDLFAVALQLFLTEGRFPVEFVLEVLGLPQDLGIDVLLALFLDFRFPLARLKGELVADIRFFCVPIRARDRLVFWRNWASRSCSLSERSCCQNCFCASSSSLAFWISDSALARSSATDC